MAVEKTDDVGVSLAPRAPSRPKSLWQVGPCSAAWGIAPHGYTAGRAINATRPVLLTLQLIGSRRRTTKKKKKRKPGQALLCPHVLLKQISFTFTDMINNRRLYICVRATTGIALPCDFVTVFTGP